ncbi:exosortase B [Actimicrobium sp. CCC2.4]|uniref:exosortase B n=1 Tax=Actimicrobium sp. CCC2.4 TaxID=3048606 RepID=UPI002AC9DEEB|nr:exosortase B [Actimicrobium sp. CCC2.4]MEB0136026.1 exosortase B [Actimicrobium sp. CCC2.4]WPX32689.1 exosortase B [Actimicrobium sp. CCC2.4]
MATTLSQPIAVNRAQFLPWILILVGLCAVYGPTFYDLFHGAWSTEKNAQGPIVMGVSFYFLYYRVKQLLERGLFDRSPAPVVGSLMLGFGLLCYAVGRSQSVLLLEVGSLVVVLSGMVVTFYGVRTWSRMWFAFFFMLFMIPLPASVVDAVTQPLKIGVSYATEHLLYWAGYPIARSGVILTIGQYQLLVADACAGLNSLFVLEALGLLYMNLVRHSSVVRNVVLATLIVPISFAANTIRIIFLALITYYFGDAAGQGFVHGFSGIVLFLSALLLIISVDGVISRLVRDKAVTPTLPVGLSCASKSVRLKAWRAVRAVTSKASLAIMLAMFVAVGATYALTPVMGKSKAMAPLATSVPTQFGEWTEIKSLIVQADLTAMEDGKKSIDQPYDDVLTRTYVNKAGDQVMLALAYAKEQRQDVKIHLPEVCYPAQGYQVLSNIPTSLAVLPDGGSVPGKRLLTTGNGRTEAVSYWVRIGDAYPRGGLATRLKIFRDGIGGNVTDGMLVRASMLINDAKDSERAYKIQEDFLKEIVAAVNSNSNVLIN